MSSAVKEKNIYEDAFREFAGERTGEPSWVARLREGAFERFEETGFPTTDEEDWKYTNVAPIARKSFRTAVEKVELESDTVETFVSAEAGRSRLVFVNGVYSPGHSSLEAIPSGVSVEELGAALAGEHGEVLWNHLGRLSGEGSDAFTALNTAFLGGGALLVVPKGVVVESPVQLLFLNTRAEVVTFPRVLVVAERDSRLDLIETHAATSDA